jgi:hypothetical protein
MGKMFYSNGDVKQGWFSNNVYVGKEKPDDEEEKR